MPADGELPSPHRDRRKAETRRRVLDAARELFSRYGYDGVTIRMIADAAGVAVGSVFTTLPSKSAVLDAIVIDSFEEQHRRVDAAIASGGDLVSRLRALFEALYAYHDPQLTLLLQVIAHSWVHQPEAEALVRGSAAPLYRRVETLLRDARAEGELAADVDLQLVAETLFASYIANYRRAAYDAWTVQDLAELMEKHIRLVLCGAGLKAEMR